MATESTAKKPAAKKTATRRKTTTPRKPAAKKTPVKKIEDFSTAELERVLEERYKEAREKEIETKLANEFANPSEEIPDAPSKDVSREYLLEAGPGNYDITSPTGKSEKTVEAVPPVKVPLFARNLRNTLVSYRLARQADGKRTDLQPRGNRGDIVKLEDGDIEDPQFIDVVAYGLVEIITASEAADAIQKQSTNQQQAPHPAFALLRSELDQPYAPGSVKLETEFGHQGQVVGQVQTPNPVTGDGNLGRGGGQSPISRPSDNPAGVSQLPSPQNNLQGDAAAQARDAAARAVKENSANTVDSPNALHAALGGLSVSVAPTQRS